MCGVGAVRLVDQVLASAETVRARDRNGRVHSLTGVASRSALIADCRLRFVLERDASAQCFDLIRSDTGLLRPDNELLRLPAEYFWMEWFPENVPGRCSNGRMGALVEADPAGRRGLVTGFFTTAAGQADLTIVSTQFDLDRPVSVPAGSATALKVRHGTLPHLNGLLDHVAFHLDPSWVPFMRAQLRGQFHAQVRDLAEANWFNLPMVLAFCAMLNSRGVLRETPSDLSRLNRLRERQGKRPLAEHIEVRMQLGAPRGSAVPHTRGAERAPARLHHVRGHFVSRGGATFWRSSHLRGEPDAAVTCKTVRVLGAAPASSPNDCGTGGLRGGQAKAGGSGSAVRSDVARGPANQKVQPPAPGLAALAKQSG